MTLLEKSQSKLSVDSNNQFYFKDVKRKHSNILTALAKKLSQYLSYKEKLKLSWCFILTGIIIIIIYVLLIYFSVDIKTGYGVLASCLIGGGLLISPAYDMDAKNAIINRIALYPAVFLLSLLGVLYYLDYLLSAKNIPFFLHIFYLFSFVVFVRFCLAIVEFLAKSLNLLFIAINQSENLLTKSISLISSILALISSMIGISLAIK